MKLKYLLSAVLFFYSFNSFSQGNSNLTMGGCYSYWSTWLHYTSFPPADSMIYSGSIFDVHTVYMSGFDSVVFNADWDGGDCGPLGYGAWFKDSIVMDTTYSLNSLNTTLTVYQPGNYHARLVGYPNNYPQAYVWGLRFINTNSTTSINDQTNPDLNVTIIKNKIIVKDLLEKDNLLLSVYDLTGRIVFTKDIIHPSSSFEMDMPELSNGLYVFNLRNKNFNFLKKFSSNTF